jgi:hypothetical protein
MSIGTNNNDVDDTNNNNRIKSLNPKVYKDLKKIEQEGREKGLTEKEIAHECLRFINRQMHLNIRELNDIYPRLSREVDANPTDKFPELLRLMRTINPSIEELAILLKKYSIKARDKDRR